MPKADGVVCVKSGLEFVDIIVKSDNEPPLTSLIESSSTLRAMKSGSRMSIGEQPCWRFEHSDGIVDRAIHSCAGNDNR